jgi:hypothetical protein
MSTNLRHVYAQRALSQIPRLLSLEDRNAFSPTYGCFKRTYWLDKVDDFPDALPQFGVLSLALAYACKMPENPYYEQPQMREWILAGMKYWTKIQHKDGSFDEFYPNEHGWTGPTGFLLYAMLKSYMLLDERKEFPADFREEFFTACRKAARYIIAWDEHGVLANHHAMGVLPVYYTWHVLREEEFKIGYEKKLEEFLTFCSEEGWSLEYDGADIGYLSATVSFLGKVYKLNKDERLKKVMEKSVEFLSYFVYPDGFYAGSMGSRQTLHFYSHGCEILAHEMPLAGRVADALLHSLCEGKLVPAEIMPDRYFLYRIPEHLESYVDYGERHGSAQLPYERGDFRTVFPDGRFYAEKRGSTYLLGNAAKGGVLKYFDADAKILLCSDCGVIGSLEDGTILTSQWIDVASVFTPAPHGFSVKGLLHRVPSHKLFTPVKFIIFRVFLLLFGWNTLMAYNIKGLIRRMLMLKSGSSPVSFERTVELKEQDLLIKDVLTLTDAVSFSKLQLGGEFAVRYVPQSRYFQSYEMAHPGMLLTTEQLQALSRQKTLTVERVISLKDETSRASVR